VWLPRSACAVSTSATERPSAFGSLINLGVKLFTTEHGTCTSAHTHTFRCFDGTAPAGRGVLLYVRSLKNTHKDKNVSGFRPPERRAMIFFRMMFSSDVHTRVHVMIMWHARCIITPITV
jgi:hypothetical protein